MEHLRREYRSKLQVAVLLSAMLSMVGVSQVSISTSGSYFNDGDTVQVAVTYDASSVTLPIDGGLIGEDTSVSIPNMSIVRFGRFDNAAPFLNPQAVKQVSLWDTKLTPAEAVSLTS